MDAKLMKFLSATTVALMVLSVFGVIAAPAVAVGSSPLEITPDSAEYNSTVTIQVVNATAGGQVILNDTDETVRVVEADQDGKATFSDVKLNKAGAWTVTDVTGEAANTPNSTATFTVEPQEIVFSDVTPTSLTYTPGMKRAFSGTLSLADGTALKGATVTLTTPKGAFPSVVTTDSSGKFTIYDVAIDTNGAGSYNLSAVYDTTSAPNAPHEAAGHHVIRVASSTLSAEFSTWDNEKTPVRGFSDKGYAVLNFTYANGDKVNFNNAQALNMTVTSPKGTKYFFDYDGMAWTQSDSANLSVAIEASNQLNFTSAPLWATDNGLGSGTYKIALRLDLDNQNNEDSGVAETKLYEYNNTASALSFAVGEAAKTNFEVSLGSKDVPATSGTIGTVNLLVNIFGVTQDTVPNATEPAYLNVTGDVLEPVKTYVITSGSDAIPLTPTRGQGTINYEIKWKGATHTGAVSTSTKGLQVDVDQSEVTVGSDTPLTVTVRDSYGNLIPNAVVTLAWWNQSNDTVNDFDVIDGGAEQGAPDKGKDGQYKFTVDENEIGSVLVIAKDTRLVSGSQVTRYAYTAFGVVRAHDIVTTVNHTDLTAGVSKEIRANLTVGSDGVTAADNGAVWLVPAASYDDFADDFATDPTATPTGSVAFSADSSVDGEWTLTPAEGLDAGEYYVFARNKTHDNFGSEPKITVHNATVTFSPALIPTGFDDEVNVTISVVDHEGNPLKGTLTADVSGTEAGEFVARDGNVTSGSDETNLVLVIDGTGNATFTGKVAGVINWTFQPDGSSATDTDGDGYDGVYAIPDQLRVVGPTITVSPAKVPVGAAASLQVAAKDLNGVALENVCVAFRGNPIAQGATDPVKTNAQGIAYLGFFPTTIGTVDVLVKAGGSGACSSNLTTYQTAVDTSGNDVSVTVYSGIQVSASPASPDQGDEVTLVVSRISSGNPPVANANVIVTYNGTEVLNTTTNSQGAATFTADGAGDYDVVATAAGLEPAALTLTAAEKVVEEPKEHKFELSNLKATPAQVELGNPVLVTVTVANTGDAEGDGTATVKLLVGGVTYETRQVSVASGDSETIAFQAFTPAEEGDLSITAALKGGDETGAQTVQVVKPEPVTPPTGGDDSTGGDDDNTGGNNGQEPTGVPGFEFVAALAALGAALIMVRRRN